MVKGLKDWLLFIFLITSVGGGMFFTQTLAFQSYKINHYDIIPFFTLYFFAGIITLIIRMPDVK